MTLTKWCSAFLKAASDGSPILKSSRNLSGLIFISERFLPILLVTSHPVNTCILRMNNDDNDLLVYLPERE